MRARVKLLRRLIIQDVSWRPLSRAADRFEVGHGRPVLRT